MQRRQRQVARFRNAQGRFDGLQIAHFTDEHHVRILAQRRAQGLSKTTRVSIDFTLVDETALVVVQELDRIFDRENVFVPLAIDFIDHGSQGSRLTRAGRAGD